MGPPAVRKPPAKPKVDTGRSKRLHDRAKKHAQEAIDGQDYDELQFEMATDNKKRGGYTQEEHDAAAKFDKQHLERTAAASCSS